MRCCRPRGTSRGRGSTTDRRGALVRVRRPRHLPAGRDRAPHRLGAPAAMGGRRSPAADPGRGRRSVIRSSTRRASSSRRARRRSTHSAASTSPSTSRRAPTSARPTSTSRSHVLGRRPVDVRHQFQIQEFRRPEFEVTARTESSGPYFAGRAGDRRGRRRVLRRRPAPGRAGRLAGAPPSRRRTNRRTGTTTRSASGSRGGSPTTSPRGRPARPAFGEFDVAVLRVPAGCRRRVPAVLGPHRRCRHALPADRLRRARGRPAEHRDRRGHGPGRQPPGVVVAHEPARARRRVLRRAPQRPHRSSSRARRSATTRSSPISTATLVAGRTITVTAGRVEWGYDERRVAGAGRRRAGVHADVDDRRRPTVRCGASSPTTIGGTYRITAVVTDDDRPPQSHADHDVGVGRARPADPRRRPASR